MVVTHKETEQDVVGGGLVFVDHQGDDQPNASYHSNQQHPVTDDRNSNRSITYITVLTVI